MLLSRASVGKTTRNWIASLYCLAEHRSVKQCQMIIDSDSGSSSDHNAEMDIENFVWEDVLGEMGRFDTFDVDMPFTRPEWRSFSKSLQNYITAKRLLSRASNRIDSDLIVPNLDLSAMSIVDGNVTIRPPSMPRTEQILVESGN